MIRPAPSAPVQKGLEFWYRIRERMIFRDIRFHGDFSGIQLDRGTLNKQTLANTSVLLISNHTSWWDGFIAHQISRDYLKKNFYVMMLEKELSQRMFLRKTGAFSIQPSTHGIRESLNYASELLQSPKNMLTFFPEGEIHTSHQDSLQFAPGVGFLLRKSPQTAVLMVCQLVDFFSLSKPVLHVYGKFADSDMFQKAPQDTYNSFYQQCRIQQEHWRCS